MVQLMMSKPAGLSLSTWAATALVNDPVGWNWQPDSHMAEPLSLRNEGDVARAWHERQCKGLLDVSRWEEAVCH